MTSSHHVGQILKMSQLVGVNEVRITKIAGGRVHFERVSLELPAFKSSATVLQFEEKTVAWNLDVAA
jgi:hypothetical protein